MRRRTKELKQKFIERYFNTAGNISKIAKEIGINRNTYYLWLEKDKRFREMIEAEREALIDFVESKLFKLIDNDNLGAICFFLKCKAKHRGYIERTEIAGSDENPLKIQVDILYTDKREEE